MSLFLLLLQLQNESDLVGLVQMSIIIFGEQPPVYSVAGQSQPPTNPTPAYPATPGTKLPSPLDCKFGFLTCFFSSSIGYPPYPSSGAGYPSSTPYPPYPPAGGVSGPTPVPYPGSYATGYPPYPSTNTNAGYPPYPNVAAAPQSTGTISDDHIRASLLSAVEDKVRRRLSEIFAQSQAEIETLKKTENELRMGQSKLQELGRKLDQEQSEVERNIASLKERSGELEEAVTKLKSQDSNFDVDEAVVTTAPIYRQYVVQICASFVLVLIPFFLFLLLSGCSTPTQKRRQRKMPSTIWAKVCVEVSLSWTSF